MASRRGSRTGTFFVLLGIVGILTTTFVAGIWTGYNWPVLFGPAKAPAVEASSRRAGAERTKPTDTLPALTFYNELKAPLTAPPPPPTRGAKAPRPAEPARREAPPESTSPPTGAVVPVTHGEPPTARAEPLPATTDATPVDARFTVQVAAFNVRTQADALCATLTAAGHDARVVEASTAGGVRYRVQVGTFPTRPAAREVAARLASERSLATFVTTR